MLLNDQSSTTHKCSNCGGDQVRRTHRVTKLDGILSLINAYPYYCQECPGEYRFHKFGRK